MVTAPKKKSYKEIRAESFNKIVGNVKREIEGNIRTDRADITLHHGKNIKGMLWESGNDKIPPRLNMTFLFKTNENRSELLEDIDAIIKRTVIREGFLRERGLFAQMSPNDPKQAQMSP